MSGLWSAYDAAQRERLAATFAVAHTADMLMDLDAAPAPHRSMPFATLYRAATDAAPMPAAVASALLADARLHADFRALLGRVSRLHVPRAAAASSGDLNRREAGGYVLRLVESRAAGDQAYLLIDMPAGAPAPARLMVVGADGSVHKEALPPPIGRAVRLLKQRDDPLLRTFRDASSELYLA